MAEPEEDQGAGTEAQAQQLDEAELARRLEEELRKLKIQDVLLQTCFTLASLGFRRVGEEDRDLEQGRLAVEALRALVPVLAGSVPQEVTRDLEQALANLQLAYAGAAKSGD